MSFSNDIKKAKIGKYPIQVMIIGGLVMYKNKKKTFINYLYNSNIYVIAEIRLLYI